MRLANQKNKTIGFSFRIDEKWLKILREEADRQGISVNALHNRILEAYCQHWRWAERMNVLLLSRPIVSGIVNCCPDEKLVEIARASGSTGVTDSLRTLGIAPNYNNLKGFIENNLAKSGKWFDYSEHTKGKKDIIHLRHELGKKWSLFIANQAATLFKTNLGITAKTEIFDNFATLKITL